MALINGKQSSRGAVLAREPAPRPAPKLLFVFADEMRHDAWGAGGDPNLEGLTPNFDALTAQSTRMAAAVSCCPVCSPYRASLMTGQYPDTHGVFLNDAPLAGSAATLGNVLKAAGYATAWVGKWHLQGGVRTNDQSPSMADHGLDYFRASGSEHDYNGSDYWQHEGGGQQTWTGFDALAQADDVASFIAAHASDKFALFLSWGPPHPPYDKADDYEALFDPELLTVPDNVPENKVASWRIDAAGYYANIAALDEALGTVIEALEATGAADDTIVVFTADHGDMLFAQGNIKKQWPYDESARVPLLVRYPGIVPAGTSRPWPINAPDVMPTLLGLCGVTGPEGMEGADWSQALRGMEGVSDNDALIASYWPHGSYYGKPEYRGIRTSRYTYVEDHGGAWLLFDNDADPLQQTNLVGQSAELQADLASRLAAVLAAREDTFPQGSALLTQWSYEVDPGDGSLPH